MVVSNYYRHLKYVHDYPGKGNTIVLLHGFLASKTYWKRIIPILNSNGNRVITIDLLGFGKSPKPKTADYSYDDHTDHILNTLHELGITESVTLVGHSMGALLALRCAEKYTKHINAVCLLNPPMYATPEQAHATLRDTNYFYRLLLDSRYRHLFWFALRKFGPLANHSRHSREGSLANVIMMARFFNDLGRTTQPILLMVGKNDRRVYLDNLQTIEIGENVSVVIEESGHHTPRNSSNGNRAAYLRLYRYPRKVENLPISRTPCNCHFATTVSLSI